MAIRESEIEARLIGNFDFIKREIGMRQGTVTLFYMDTICDSNYISHYIIEPLALTGRIPDNKEEIGRIIFAAHFGEITAVDQAIEHILSGDPVLIFGNMDCAVYIVARKLESRAVDRSQFDSSLIGSNESFNELLVTNISLIRKRMTAENLKVESHTLGKQSKTQAVLLYLDGSAPEDLVETVRKRLAGMDNPFVTGIQYVAEALSPNNSFFDTVGYTEKPDVVVSRLFEGRIAVLVNGSPFALTAPCFFFENLQAADDYATNMLFVNLLRLLRFVSVMISLFLPGFYVALTTHHFSLIPSAFVFKLSVSRSGVPFPTVVEVLLLFLFFELSREAGRRLPQQIGQALSIVGALILGDAAVGAGLASEITVVVIGIYAITSFINPRFTPAISVWSVFSIVMSACFGLHGFFMGVILLIAHLGALRSCDYPYFFPIGTEKSFRSANRDVFIRGPLNKISKPFLYRGKKS